MNWLIDISAIVALLGSALIGGVFFAFSSFIMKALARVPSAEGIAAMQSINVVVLNRSFLGAFMGTALISLVLAGFAVSEWGTPPAPWYLGGALLYLVGTFLVTGLGNVPLNNKLAAVSPGDKAAVEVWEFYLDRWTWLNTVRTVAAVVAAIMFIVGLMASVKS
ncbi:MAG: DUF1772 domain-containing protein [Gammaproteobacteria bacterium]|nr:DUF1772 domain-containing protein [Gammaproteobacteria bacterium]